MGGARKVVLDAVWHKGAGACGLQQENPRAGDCNRCVCGTRTRDDSSCNRRIPVQGTATSGP